MLGGYSELFTQGSSFFLRISEGEMGKKEKVLAELQERNDRLRAKLDELDSAIAETKEIVKEVNKPKPPERNT